MSRERLALAMLCLFTAVHCGGSNEPSVMSSPAAGSGAPTSSGATTGSSSMSQQGAGSGASSASSGTAGKPTSSSSGGSGGSQAQASAGKGGSTSSSGGTSAAPSGGSGGTGTSATPSGGSGGAGGTSATPSGGSGGAMSSGNGMFTPLCTDVPKTAAGEVPKKGLACTADDPQLCYGTCGPQSIGFKSETCTNGTYAEQTGCSFLDQDYACYKIPMMIDASCPTMTPQANMPCDVAMCTLCNVNDMYLDSGGGNKTGYCVCPMAGASGMRKWSCASTTAWPCPAGRGC